MYGYCIAYDVMMTQILQSITYIYTPNKYVHINNSFMTDEYEFRCFFFSLVIKHLVVYTQNFLGKIKLFAHYAMAMFFYDFLRFCLWKIVNIYFCIL